MNLFDPPESGELDSMMARVHKQIRELQDRHRLELAPLVKILCDIEACRPPRPILIDISQMSELQQKDWLERLKASGVKIDDN